MTFVWFGLGKSFKLRSFAMTGAFLVFPLVREIGCSYNTYLPKELIILQMLVGTVAFNTLAVIGPTSTNAFAIWALGYIFQGLGMGIAFIESLFSSFRCGSYLYSYSL